MFRKTEKYYRMNDALKAVCSKVGFRPLQAYMNIYCLFQYRRYFYKNLLPQKSSQTIWNRLPLNAVKRKQKRCSAYKFVTILFQKEALGSNRL